MIKHCTTSTQKSPRIKIGLGKKKGESILFKNRISGNTNERRKKEMYKKRPDLGEEGGESVRT